MKKSMKFLLPVLFITIMAVTYSCKKGGLGYTCDSETMCGSEFTACCTAVDCYYQWGSKKYPCNGIDCSSAAEDLVEDICGYSVNLNELMVTDSNEELQEVIQMLIESTQECED
jgi:hypothetical protein